MPDRNRKRDQDGDDSDTIMDVDHVFSLFRRDSDHWQHQRSRRPPIVDVRRRCRTFTAPSVPTLPVSLAQLHPANKLRITEGTVAPVFEPAAQINNDQIQQAVKSHKERSQARRAEREHAIRAERKKNLARIAKRKTECERKYEENRSREAAGNSDSQAAQFEGNADGFGSDSDNDSESDSDGDGDVAPNDAGPNDLDADTESIQTSRSNGVARHTVPEKRRQSSSVSPSMYSNKRQRRGSDADPTLLSGQVPNPGNHTPSLSIVGDGNE
ncbi:uncharacterized protein MYCGRDRAFT_97846 [Zymoseptoria tritici IPO323]|uniref:Uncharacterized protein n=1 Tax=Zymoseptoria tritici (strain CBS 115943 / IPO323) TaxID=336722 RepID=F9XRK0_ZYMTI|nr:uncharacterized protein MYCGRDRAFT_97846 [Zymoseptoria tritici IPO323]EGP82148.1 hypothetical protein MYCGRDRAFT_97846 [Zymoseptoria tritici IPO323]